MDTVEEYGNMAFGKGKFDQWKDLFTKFHLTHKMKLDEAATRAYREL